MTILLAYKLEGGITYALFCRYVFNTLNIISFVLLREEAKKGWQNPTHLFRVVGPFEVIHLSPERDFVNILHQGHPVLVALT